MRGLLADKKPAHVIFIHGPDASEAACAETVWKDLVALGIAISRASLPSGQTLHDLARLAADPVAALDAFARFGSAAKALQIRCCSSHSVENHSFTARAVRGQARSRRDLFSPSRTAPIACAVWPKIPAMKR